MGIRDFFLKRFSRNKQEKFYAYAPSVSADWSGDKNGVWFGWTTNYRKMDYWTLRTRSMQLFTENPYARAIVKKIVRHEIFTGIRVESNPIGDVLWKGETEEKQVENSVRFGEKLTQEFEMYANNPDVFDYQKQLTFGEFQELVRRESILCGDGIIVSRINKKTGLPCWQWINGNYVKGQCGKVGAGNEVRYGVELDRHGRHVAYHVEIEENGQVVQERIPCYGEKSGRRIAWMVYGMEKRSDDVRGEPLLSVILTMLKDLDRYKDAELRAADVNAMLAYTVETTDSSRGGTNPVDGISRRGVVSEDEKKNVKRHPPIEVMMPGTVFDDLAPGEKVQSYDTKRPNVNFGAFKNEIFNDICMAMEVPPSVVKMIFEGSYNASRNAMNMFQVFIDSRVQKNAKDFLQAIYEEFVTQSVLVGNFELPNFIKDCVFGNDYRKKAAWFSANWTGMKLPAVDPLKTAKALSESLDNLMMTYDDASRITTGRSIKETALQMARQIKFFNSLGLVPKAREDNNGKAAYSEEEEEDE